MRQFAPVVFAYFLGALATANAATFQFQFMDDPGEGFNDPAPISDAQRGNNPGMTLGQARQNVLIEAGRIWGNLLVSDVPIVVRVSFNPQPCDAMMGTLASAGARTFFRNFADGLSPDTFFASALADSLAGENLMLQTANPEDPDITATFNLSVDTDPGCLNGAGFYYGLDNNPTFTLDNRRRIDALVVALHELAHGFGFQSEIRLDTGNGFPDNRFSSFVLQIFDEQLQRSWPMLTAAERMTSAVGNAGLTWNGSNVNNNFVALAPGVTSQRRLRLFSPAPASPGSSVSHWTTLASPNLLMEPNISRDLTRSVDVTVCALRDIGWQTTRCPDSNAPGGAAPVANNQMVTVAEDTVVTITLTASDADSSTLTYSPTQPTFGVLSAGNSATRTYTPNLNANGPDSFTFSASDGSNTSLPATVTINITPVNDVPIAATLSAQATSGQSSSITLNGVDPDGEVVTFELVSNPANGTLTGTLPNLTYRSNANFVGADSFTYRVRDASTVSNTAQVSINVIPSSTPVPGGRGGGGGAMGGLLVAALALLAVARGRRRQAQRQG